MRADTAMHLYIADENGNRKLAVSDRRINDKLTAGFVAPKMEMLNKARMVVLDTNIPEETIALVCERCRAPVFAAPVSARSAEKLLHHDGRIQDRDSLERAADIIMEKGVKNVFILVEKGGYCACCDEQFMQNAGSSVERVGTNGAAEAFMSGVTLGFMKHMGIRQMAKLGQAAAGITLEVEENVNPQLCIPAVAERAKIEL